ncbi:tetratricopeptide repeat protein [Candidatus Uhrbacteria bacterium]|nr:tetratricopeptide repeat protein [Candidatus Uhrbacteria bacterium]
MTYFDWALVGIFFISLIAVVVVLFRKIPQLVVIDLETIAKEREARVRERLLRARIERRFARLFHWRPLHALAHKMDFLAHKLEEGGKETSPATDVAVRGTSAETLTALLAAKEKERARGFLSEEETSDAVARSRVASDQEIAALHVELGAALEKEGRHADALAHYEDAVLLVPNHPKYLDALATAAILVGNRDRAAETLAQLKAVNPENEKISAFEEQIRALAPVKSKKKK